MRIGLVSVMPPPSGGIATWTEKYVEHMRNRHIDIDFVDISLKGSRAKDFTSKRRIIDELLRNRVIKKQITKMIDAGVEVVHFNTSFSKWGKYRDALLIKRINKAKIPVIVHFHCDIRNQVENRIDLITCKSIMNNSDCSLVLNQKSHDFLSQYTKRLRVIPNFIENAHICEKHEIKTEIENALYVGHVQFSKGFLEIVELAKEYPQIAFKLVGTVKEEAKAIETPNNLIFVGELDKKNVIKQLDESDVFIFPSHAEGFSISLLEAMSRGLPCLVSDVGANKEMIENKGGLVVDAKQPKDYAKSFSMMQDAFVRQQMSEWNIQKVRDNYTVDNVIDKLIKIYEMTSKTYTKKRG